MFRSRVAVAALCGAVALAAGADARLRKYFISVDEVTWDYGPGGVNRLDNRPFASVQNDVNNGLPMGSREFMHQPFLWMTRMPCMAADCSKMPGRIGSQYLKAHMVAYTDETFTTPVTVTNSEAHLGILGPTMRASVGDTLEIVFRNNFPGTSYTGAHAVGLSLHPHGVFYNKESEGAPYFSNYSSIASPDHVADMRRATGQEAAERRAAYDAAPAPSAEETAARYLRSLKGADASSSADAEELAGSHARRAGVHPNTGPGSSIAYGQTYTYTWEVPERAGPGPNDGSSVAWFYHSHVDEPSDTNLAMMGAIVVSDPARADPVTAKPTDVDREIVTIFSVTDENVSPLIMHNAINIANALRNVSEFAAMTNIFGGSKHPMFIQGNLMHNINGRSYGTLDGVYMYKGERVRWYLGSLGNERDVHGAHWHANTLLWNGNRVDSVPLVPAVMTAADMIPDNVGVWQFHCHTNHHVHGGMTGLYEVLPALPPATTTAGTAAAASTSSVDQTKISQLATVGLIIGGVFLVVVAALLCTAGQKESEDAPSKKKAVNSDDSASA